MFSPDKLNTPTERKETHVIEYLSRDELRLNVVREAAWPADAAVRAVRGHEPVTPLVIDLDHPADCDRMDASSSAYVNPPGNDLAEVSQRAISTRQQVLHIFKAQSRPSDRLVQRRDLTGRGSGRCWLGRTASGREVVCR